MSTNTILLIEDDATEARLAQRTLNKIDASLEVVHLENGGAFIDHITNEKGLEDVSLAIMDLHMPVMGGLDVLQHLHDQQINLPFPIILFSSSQDPAEIKRAYTLGGYAFVNKPNSLAEYRVAVKHIVNFWITTNRLP